MTGVRKDAGYWNLKNDGNMVRDHARRLSNIVLGVVLKDKTLAKIFERG